MKINTEESKNISAVNCLLLHCSASEIDVYPRHRNVAFPLIQESSML